MEENRSWRLFCAGIVGGGLAAYLATPVRLERSTLSLGHVVLAAADSVESRQESAFTDEWGSDEREPILALVGDPGQPTETHMRQVADVRDALLDLRRSGRGNYARYAELLRLLATQGEDGMGEALNLLSDVAFDFTARGPCFQEAFHGLTDERIYPAVVGLLARYRDAGWAYTFFRDGYYQMLAEHGGIDGAKYLWERIREDGADRTAPAALATVDGELGADMVLADLGRYPQFCVPAVAEALAAWREPRVTDRLLQLADDPNRPTRFRESAIQGVAAQMTDPDQAEALIDRYSSSDSGVDRTVAMRAAYGIGRNSDLSANTKRTVAIPALLSALRDPVHGVRSAALSAINDVDVYQTVEIESALVELLDGGLEDRERVELLIGRVRYRR